MGFGESAEGAGVGSAIGGNVSIGGTISNPNVPNNTNHNSNPPVSNPTVNHVGSPSSSHNPFNVEAFIDPALKITDKRYATQLDRQYGYDIGRKDDPEQVLEQFINNIGARAVKPFDEEGNNISMGYRFNYVVDNEDVLKKSAGDCKNVWLCIPNISVPDSVKNLGFIDEKNNEKYTWKTVKDINDIADKIDEVQDAHTLVKFLSDAYKQLEIRNLFNPTLTALITEYELHNTPARMEDYADLSAYLNAPFKQVTIEPTAENEELKKILDELDKLSLENLDIPLVQVDTSDLTTREVDGKGVFDFIGSSVMNQLEMLTNRNLITKTEVAQVYSNLLVQGLQTAAQFTLEKANILNQSYAMRVQATQAAVAVLQAKAQLLTLPIQIRLQYAQLDAQLKQLELLKVQTEIEKEKYPQMQAQTDLILAQTDGQRLQNEQAQVAIQTGKLGIEQTKEQIALMKEQHKQAIVQTATLDSQRKVQEIQIEVAKSQVDQSREQTKQLVLANNKLIEDTKLVDAQTQLQLKQVMLADVQKIQAKAAIKLQAQQLEKEKEGLGLIKAQTAAAYAQLAALEEQMKAAKAQYNDKIDGKRIGGVLGAQIAVNKAQAVGFERDAFIKFMNQAQSGWAAKKTADIGTLSPSSYNALGIDRLMTWGAHKLFNMPIDTFAMPAGYSDYVPDEEMDAKYATSTSSNSKKPVDPKKPQ